MTDEQKKEQQEVQEAPAQAQSITDMELTHAEELASLQQANQQQYTNVDQIVSEAESKLAALQQKDETAQKRSNAFRYIAGLGDTISGIANLVGTAHGAQNQQQTYNSNIVAEKAEQARKERKLETDKISARLDEMRARQRELKTAGSLAEAELKAKQNRELAAERIRVDALERETAYRDRMLAVDEMNAETARINAEKTKGSSSTSKEKIVPVMGPDGKMINLDVSRYKDFWGDYQKALDAAIAAGTSGLTDEEIKDYQNAVRSARTDSNKALNEFLRTHIYRQNIIDQMNAGAKSDKYK